MYSIVIMYEGKVFAGKKEKTFESSDLAELIWFCRCWSKIIKAKDSSIFILQENKVIHQYVWDHRKDLLIQVGE